MEPCLSNMSKWFRMAKKASEQSEYKYKVGAVIVKGGSLLASACNEIRYRQIGSNRYTDWKESLHAERAVISQFDKDELKGCSIYIYRKYNDGRKTPALAKPCSQCAKLISDVGIKKVFYTHPEFPFFEEIKL